MTEHRESVSHWGMFPAPQPEERRALVREFKPVDYEKYHRREYDVAAACLMDC